MPLYNYTKSIKDVTNKVKMKLKVSIATLNLDLLMVHQIMPFYSVPHYIQLHTILLSLWMRWPIRGVQMSHRWNAGVVLSAGTPTENLSS